MFVVNEETSCSCTLNGRVSDTISKCDVFGGMVPRM